jgi:hypothetical protein
MLTVLSQAVQVPAGSIISGWVFFYDAEAATETLFCDAGSVGVVLNGGGREAPILFTANSCATPSNASTRWTFFQWQTPIAGTLQIQGSVVNIGDSAVPSRLGLDGVQIAEPAPRPVSGGGAAISGANGTRDNLARQAAANAAVQQAATAAVAAATQASTATLRPPNTGDAGLLDQSSDRGFRNEALAAVLGLTFLATGLLYIRSSATRR